MDGNFFEITSFKNCIEQPAVKLYDYYLPPPSTQNDFFLQMIINF